VRTVQRDLHHHLLRSVVLTGDFARSYAIGLIGMVEPDWGAAKHFAV
jgi:hypothetical protein